MLSQSDSLESPMGIWRAGFRVGLGSLTREPGLGFKRLVLPVSYWRAREFSFACSQLRLSPGSKLLDLGSPKDLAAFLARYRGHEVVATDILPQAIELSRRLAVAQGIDGTGPGKVHSEVQDGRALPYSDHTFDAAFSVSVVEHIPDDGDSAAVTELVRVVKPGGTIVVTVPFAEKTYDTFVDRPVYEREQLGGAKVFFERHYDEAALEARLIRPSGAEVKVREFWGENSLRMGSFLDRHKRMRMFMSPFEAALSRWYLRKVDHGSGHRMAAFLKLEKPGR
jgi:SAM-dependent methyltransferase